MSSPHRPRRETPAVTYNTQHHQLQVRQIQAQSARPQYLNRERNLEREISQLQKAVHHLTEVGERQHRPNITHRPRPAGGLDVTTKTHRGSPEYPRHLPPTKKALPAEGEQVSPSPHQSYIKDPNIDTHHPNSETSDPHDPNMSNGISHHPKPDSQNLEAGPRHSDDPDHKPQPLSIKPEEPDGHHPTSPNLTVDESLDPLHPDLGQDFHDPATRPDTSDPHAHLSATPDDTELHPSNYDHLTEPQHEPFKNIVPKPDDAVSTTALPSYSEDHHSYTSDDDPTLNTSSHPDDHHAHSGDQDPTADSNSNNEDENFHASIQEHTPENPYPINNSSADHDLDPLDPLDHHDTLDSLEPHPNDLHELYQDPDKINQVIDGNPVDDSGDDRSGLQDEYGADTLHLHPREDYVGYVKDNDENTDHDRVWSDHQDPEIASLSSIEKDPLHHLDDNSPFDHNAGWDYLEDPVSSHFRPDEGHQDMLFHNDHFNETKQSHLDDDFNTHEDSADGTHPSGDSQLDDTTNDLGPPDNDHETSHDSQENDIHDINDMWNSHGGDPLDLDGQNDELPFHDQSLDHTSQESGVVPYDENPELHDYDANHNNDHAKGHVSQQNDIPEIDDVWGSHSVGASDFDAQNEDLPFHDGPLDHTTHHEPGIPTCDEDPEPDVHIISHNDDFAYTMDEIDFDPLESGHEQPEMDTYHEPEANDFAYHQEDPVDQDYGGGYNAHDHLSEPEPDFDAHYIDHGDIDQDDTWKVELEHNHCEPDMNINETYTSHQDHEVEDPNMGYDVSWDVDNPNKHQVDTGMDEMDVSHHHRGDDIDNGYWGGQEEINRGHDHSAGEEIDHNYGGGHENMDTGHGHESGDLNERYDTGAYDNYASDW